MNIQDPSEIEILRTCGIYNTICSLQRELTDHSCKLTAVQAKTKFKNLNDTYRRLVQTENLPSGSATKATEKKWAHYDAMEFLRDSCLKKPAVENDLIDDESPTIHDTDEPEGYEYLEIPDITPVVGGKRNKKKQPTPAANAMERIADAICQPPKDISFPPMPQPDEVSGCLTVLDNRLRNLNPSTRLRIMQKLLELTYEALIDNSDLYSPGA